MRPTFFELRNISFVNWYLFAADDIAIEGSVALVGANGTGKSSIIDGIQVVLSGNSAHHYRLNSSAQQSVETKRTVLAYCLGVLDDVSDAQDGIRSQCLTWLMLGFKHKTTGEEITIGISMAAKLGEGRVRDEAPFIVHDRILRAADVTRSGVDAEGPWIEALSFTEVKERLEAEGARVEKFPNATRFIAEYATVLGPRRGQMDYQRFMRSLRNAVQFKSAVNPNDFIRKNILTNERVDISGLRLSMASYKAIKERITQLEKRIEDIGRVGEAHREVVYRRNLVGRQRLVLEHAKLLRVQRRCRDTRSERDACLADIEEIASRLPELDAERTRANEARDEVVRRRAESSVERERQGLFGEIRLLEEKKGRAVQELAPAARAIVVTRGLSAKAREFNGGLADRLERIPEPVPGDIDEQLGALLRGSLRADLETLREKIGRLAAKAERERDAIEEDIARLEENLARVGEGKLPLDHRTTLPLMATLKRAGIESMALCEAVDAIADESWRDAAEAALGRSREALLVDPADYDRAFDAYRAAGIWDAQVVDTTKTAGTPAAKDGSLATMILTANPHARAFIDFRLGGVMMVETASESRGHGSAITKDLMSSGSRVVRKLKRPDRYLLGRAGSQDHLSSLAVEIDERRGDLDRATRDALRLRERERDVSRVLEALEEARKLPLADILRRLSFVEGEIERCEDRLEQLEEWAEDFEAQIAAADAALGAAEAAATDRRLRIARGEEKAEALRATLTALRAEEADADLARSRVIEEMADPELHLEQIQAYWDDIHPRGEEGVAALAYAAARELSFDGATIERFIADVDERVRRNTPILQRVRDRLLEALGEYLRLHDVAAPDCLGNEERDIAEIGAWIDAERHRLVENELLNYRQKAQDALESVREQLVGDFIAKMRDEIEKIEQEFRNLNRQLAKTPFHGLTLGFVKRRDPDREHMLSLIEAGSDVAWEGSLFERRSEFDDGLGKALAELEGFVDDPDRNIDEITDPKLYFTYDVVMKDENGREQTDLSKRLGTASGGQVQAPFYVALAAAIKSAAYPGNQAHDGGVPLALFDEAFGKMDDASIRSCLDFMDEIGLQVFLAAPDSKRITFSQMVQTVISIARSGRHFTVDVQRIKARTHETFLEENPSLHEFDAFRRRMLEQRDKTAAE
ncbi:SbcC/MukB-like Walker B domain-containing protein [Salinarimonas sp. NSM]|uniref:SbcC/MukB-like Walker B domain-containing protein n=1 Tax=Salinarimonas sp. NSM TaxID=3458003 RepID=UPI004035FD59